jgi:hypothetical protein
VARIELVQPFVQQRHHSGRALAPRSQEKRALSAFRREDRAWSESAGQLWQPEDVKNCVATADHVQPRNAKNRSRRGIGIPINHNNTHPIAPR